MPPHMTDNTLKNVFKVNYTQSNICTNNLEGRTKIFVHINNIMKTDNYIFGIDLIQ